MKTKMGLGKIFLLSFAIFSGVIMFLFSAPLFALGAGETKTHTVEVTGLVRLVGSSPVYELVITNEDREWYIDEKDQKKLWLLQQQIVTVKAKEYFHELTFANGVPAGRQYFLKDIKIITEKN